MNSKVIEVLVPPLPQSFSYELPEKFAQGEIGCRVIIPFGRRKSSGYIIKKRERCSEDDQKDFTLKAIEGIEGNYKHFDPSQLNFFNWVADYYGDTLSSVLEVAIPPSVPQKYERTIVLNKSAESFEPAGSLQKKIIDFLRKSDNHCSYAELNRRLSGAHSVIKKLAALKIITINEHEVVDQHICNEPAPLWAKHQVDLNQDQESAYQKITQSITAHTFEPYLLHGITGSGKTEVYIEAVRSAREQGYGALIIVPEIALTPQLIDRFKARLGSQIAVLHSALNKRARWDAWRALLEKRAFVAIGARSAIFAPVDNLGLVIVDEEHDQSYKQSDGLRYNGRDLALVRGRLEHCPVVLGSATPSLETYAHAVKKRYHYLPLPARHGSATLSKIELVDLNSIKPWEMASRNISPRLYEELSHTLERGEQAFVLYNRRGFATYLQCDSCDEVLQCPHCSVTLTYHQGSNALLCHYCSFSMFPPVYCPKCEPKLTGTKKKKKDPEGKYLQRGAGTEKIFEEIKALFPNAVVERLDRDAAADMATYRAILERARNKETQIVVGTQMIAKGHDLPEVTLVGIADCDVGLHMPDFRASERIFHLLTQAAGRAGRAEKAGRVILQTRVPKHPSILCTLAKDYEGFARIELKNRKMSEYPPFTRLIRIIVSSPERSYPQQILESFKVSAIGLIEKKKLAVTVLGPAPTPISRVKNQWRWHLLMRSTNTASLHEILQALRSLKVHTSKVRISFDVDPQDMM